MKKDETPKVRTRLTAEEYWEWRTTITELLLEQEKLKVCQAEAKLMHKDSEGMAMRAQLHSLVRVKALQDKVDLVKAGYETHKSKLEEKLGCSLNNKVISDETFEIKDLPQGK